MASGDFYKDGIKKGITFSVADRSVSMRTIAWYFPKKPLKRWSELFGMQKAAIGIKKGRLKMVDGRKLKKFLAENLFKNIGSLKHIGSMGCMEGDVCYVVTSDDGNKATEETILHEALHLEFGPHPWPHEKELTVA